MDLRADHVGGALPEVLAAVAAALGPDGGTAASYGADAWTARAQDAVRAVFARAEAEVLLVTNGTASNALALACLTPPFGAVYCADSAHIFTSECGAPEFYSGGARLEVVETDIHGKMDIGALAAQLEATRANPKFPHTHVPAAVSITQPTESGGLYTVGEIRAICELAREHGLLVHMDGARFANAVAAAQVSSDSPGALATPAAMTWEAGVDVLSLGTTKNGTLCCEAVVFFTEAEKRAREARLRSKRGGLFLEKQRFLAAQMLAYLENDLWLRAARDANARAADLAAGIAAAPSCDLVRSPAVNILFVEMDKTAIAALAEKGVLLSLTAGSPKSRGTPTDPATRSRFRMCTQWSTTPEQVEDLLRLIREVCRAESAP